MGRRGPQRAPRRTQLLGCLRNDDADGATPPPAGEEHHTIRLGEQRVISADANIHTWVETGTALTNQDRPGSDELAPERLPFL